MYLGKDSFEATTINSSSYDKVNNQVSDKTEQLHRVLSPLNVVLNTLKTISFFHQNNKIAKRMLRSEM